jgi:hypothetical protein
MASSTGILVDSIYVNDLPPIADYAALFRSGQGGHDAEVNMESCVQAGYASVMAPSHDRYRRLGSGSGSNALVYGRTDTKSTMVYSSMVHASLAGRKVRSATMTKCPAQHRVSIWRDGGADCYSIRVRWHSALDQRRRRNT